MIGVRVAGTTVSATAVVRSRVTATGMVALWIDASDSSAGVDQAVVLAAGRQITVGLAETELAWGVLSDDPMAEQASYIAAAVVGGVRGRFGPVMVVSRDTTEPGGDEPVFTSAPIISFSSSPAQEGDSVSIVLATAIGHDEMRHIFQVRAPGGVWVATPLWNVAPDLTADVEARLVAGIRRTGGDWIEWPTDAVLVRALGTPRTLRAGDVAMLRSDLIPAQAVWFRPVLQLPGLVGETILALQWSAVIGSPSEGDWHPLVAKPGEAGSYEPFMTNAGDNVPLQDDPRVDLSVFSAAEVARRAAMRVRWRASALQSWSLPSAAISVPVAAPPPVLTAPTAAMVGETIAIANLISYNTLTLWTGTDGSGRNFRRQAHCCTVVALAALLGDVNVYTGGRTAYARTLQQLQWWAAGRMPARGGGYPSQFTIDFVAAVCIARLIPGMWDDLQPVERTRLSLAVEACWIEACMEIAARNHWRVSGMSNRTIRGFQVSPNASNFRTPPAMTAFVPVPFLGGAAAATVRLNSWTVSDFMARMAAVGGEAGMGDVWRQFSMMPWTSAKLTAAGHDMSVPTSSMYRGDGPTTAQLEASLRNWSVFSAGYTLAQAEAQAIAETRLFFSNVIQPGLGPNAAPAETWGMYEATTGSRMAWVGRLLDMSLAPSMPYLGEVGLPFEFKCADAGGWRSSTEYVQHGLRALACALVAMIAQGQLSRGAVGMGDADGAMLRMRRGVAATRWILTEAGYRDRSKAGAPDTANQDLSPAQFLSLGWLPNSICGLLDHCVDGWFRSPA